MRPSLQHCPRARRWLCLLALLIPLALFATLAYTAWSIWSYAQRDEATPADAAIVLGAACWGDQPSPVFRERLNHALDLYRQGTVRKLIFTGAPDSLNEPAESEVARTYALQQGIPAADILVETHSRITEENLDNARQVAGGQGLRSFIIVSDPLHMKRAMLVAHDLGMEAYSSPTHTSRYQSLHMRLLFLARETLYYILYRIYRPFAQLEIGKRLWRPNAQHYPV